jgi:hypothetical protein
LFDADSLLDQRTKIDLSRSHAALKSRRRFVLGELPDVLNLWTSAGLPEDELRTTILEQLPVSWRWRSLASSFDVAGLARVVRCASVVPRPTTEEWATATRPVSYDFRRGWHAQLVIHALFALSVLGMICATVAIVPLYQKLTVGVGLSITVFLLFNAWSTDAYQLEQFGLRFKYSIPSLWLMGLPSVITDIARDLSSRRDRQVSGVETVLGYAMVLSLAACGPLVLVAALLVFGGTKFAPLVAAGWLVISATLCIVWARGLAIERRATNPIHLHIMRSGFARVDPSGNASRWTPSVDETPHASAEQYMLKREDRPTYSA